jgi:two-component system, NarL family, nitrate/nitrite response regulator NarL
MIVRTVIADNQIMFSEGLQAILKDIKHPAVKVVGMATNSDELHELMVFPIDMIIVNPSIFNHEDFSWIKLLRKIKANLKVVVVTEINNLSIVKSAFVNGADGYVLKSNQSLELFQCIDRVMEGQTFMAEGLSITPEYNKHKTQPEPKLKFDERFAFKQKLTKREREILGLIVQCKNNKDIAKELYISDQTASVHRKSIMKKFGVNSTNALIKFTIENQII